MSNGDWIVHTHMGFERKNSREEAERQADFLRSFFRNRPDSDIWIEPPDEPAPAAVVIEPSAAEVERCPRCAGTNSNHGLVHVRHGNGGGHNEPCPRTVAPETDAGEGL